MCALRQTRMFVAIVINGSFMMAIPEPNDIDLILILPSDHDWNRDVRPDEYILLIRRRLWQRFGFDVFLVVDGTEACGRVKT